LWRVTTGVLVPVSVHWARVSRQPAWSSLSMGRTGTSRACRCWYVCGLLATSQVVLPQDLHSPGNLCPSIVFNTAHTPVERLGVCGPVLEGHAVASLALAYDVVLVLLDSWERVELLE
jgi:hypothetical protein